MDQVAAPEWLQASAKPSRQQYVRACAGAPGDQRQQRVHAAGPCERRGPRKIARDRLCCGVAGCRTLCVSEGRQLGSAAIVRAGMDQEDSEALERLGFSKDRGASGL